MEKEKQIKDVTAFLMVFTALFFDALQAVIGWIPAVGNILAACINAFAFMTFSFWFYMNGIKMMRPQRIIAMLGAGVIELIPYLNLLPAWTFAVVYLIGTTKVKEFASKHSIIASTIISAEERFKNKGKVPGVNLDKAA